MLLYVAQRVTEIIAIMFHSTLSFKTEPGLPAMHKCLRTVVPLPGPQKHQHLIKT